MPAKRLVIVSAACLRHLRSLLRTRARHVCICAVRSRLEAAVRLGAPWRAKFHILVRVLYSADTFTHRMFMRAHRN
jgi:hypothetical protein